MAGERIAVVSDVHGNLTAYEAVLADVAGRGITRVLNLGDVVGKGPRGSACVALTRERCEVTVRGNWDALVAGPLERLWSSGRWWREELDPDDLGWLAALPSSHELELGGRRVRLVHASATSEFVRVHARHTDEEAAGMFAVTGFTGGGPSPDVVGYGDIHATYVEDVGGRTLFNAGSVGNPLDEPSAAYAVLTADAAGAGVGIQFVRVDYDVEAEIALARRTGMPEADAYAIELRTAVYRGAHEALGLVAAPPATE